MHHAEIRLMFLPVERACANDCRTSHPITRPVSNPFPRILINLVKIIRYGENHAALRAGQNRANSARNQAKLAVTGTTLHAFFPFPAPKISYGGRCITFYYTIGA